MAKKSKSYEEFNKFQTAFYTDKEKLNNFTHFDFKRHGYTLLSNLAKGFPNLADIFLNLKGIDWVGPECPPVIKALQFKFVNNFNLRGIPQFIYFKTLKPVKEKKPRIKKTKKGYVFNEEIQKEICNILLIYSKTYEYLKFSVRVQFLGTQLNGELIKQVKHKKKLNKNP